MGDMLKCEAVSVRLVKPIKLQDGEYQGIWSAYYVTLKIGDSQVEIRTSVGVRGINVPCRVIVNGDNIEIEELKLVEQDDNSTRENNSKL